ncbi:MAG: DUF2252 domain-containing protein [Microbacterium sp.]|uniref:DUF2252 domain-containing protein n=1 Tax=Microbacterium sp. TaxID=51671 RepID=UPI0039E6AC1E
MTDPNAHAIAPDADALGAGWTRPPSAAAHAAAGRDERRRHPRRLLATLTAQPARDPLGILAAQNATRVPELVPLRAERMSASPFTFYRGTAALMAADLAADPHSGILVPSCGDAHVSNFGFYASPQRTLVFDLNDFDEAAWAPWEWDLKRLIASVIIAGQASSRDEGTTRDAARAAVRAYAGAIARAATLSPTARYFTHLDADTGIDTLDTASRRALRTAVRDARRRTGERATRKLTALGDDGRLRFVSQPPTMTPLGPDLARRVHEFILRYVETTQADVRQLISAYTVSDVIRRVVGVGSVGTRCALVLLQDGDGNALIMQSKEAGRSVLEQYGGIEQPRLLRDHIAWHGEGGRVVAMQRVLQALSDPFLGYLRADGVDLYVRQFHDMKGGIEAETLDDVPFANYAQACAITLARAHSQSANAAAVAGYIGGGRVIADAILDWSEAYAELSGRDYEAFLGAQAPAG